MVLLQTFTYHMLFIMKKLSMNIQPKGNTPPTIIPGTILTKNDLAGIGLGFSVKADVDSFS